MIDFERYLNSCCNEVLRQFMADKAPESVDYEEVAAMVRAEVLRRSISESVARFFQRFDDLAAEERRKMLHVAFVIPPQGSFNKVDAAAYLRRLGGMPEAPLSPAGWVKEPGDECECGHRRSSHHPSEVKGGSGCCVLCTKEGERYYHEFQLKGVTVLGEGGPIDRLEEDDEH